MSTTDINRLRARFFPNRVLTMLPTPSGDSIVSTLDQMLICGLVPIESIPSSSSINYFMTQNVSPLMKIIIHELDNGEDVDITNWVYNFGTVKRAVNYDIGKMVPSSHSFDLMDSESSGDFLFSLRNRFGANYWMDLDYSVYLGFYDDDGEEQWENIYTGTITEKNENRITGKISVSSHDVIKQLNDYRIATIINASDVFDYETTTTDNRGIQQVVKYGTHRLITADNRAYLERNNPFSCTLGEYALGSARAQGISGSYFSQYSLWYFPFHNEIEAANYDTANINVYYFDYREDYKRWRIFDYTEYGASVWTIRESSSTNGFFLEVTNPTIVTGTDWSDYIAGTGSWSDDNFDPMVMIESDSVVTIDSVEYLGNPIAILYDLLTNDRYIGYSNDLLDYQSFVTPVVDSRTWDKAYRATSSDSALINTDIITETSLMDVIDNISSITGLSFFVTKKNSDDDDRRLKLLENSPINPKQYPLSNDQMIFSTLDKLNKFELTTNNDYKKNIVKILNFDSSTSTRNNYDLIVESSVESGDIDRVLTLGSTSSPMVYLYDSSLFGFAIVQRYLYQLNEPQELYNVSFGKAGHNVEVGNIIDIYDNIADRTLTMQVYETSTDIKTASKEALLKRYSQQFGPDEEEPLKLWGFWTNPTVTTDYYSYWSDNNAPNGGGPNGESYHWY